jgi:hypothetical protein
MGRHFHTSLAVFRFHFNESGPIHTARISEQHLRLFNFSHTAWLSACPSRDLRIITTTFERIGYLIHHAPNRLYILVDIRPVDGEAFFPNTELKFN